MNLIVVKGASFWNTQHIIHENKFKKEGAKWMREQFNQPKR